MKGGKKIIQSGLVTGMLLFAFGAQAQATNKKICIEVELQETKEAESAPVASAAPTEADQDPAEPKDGPFPWQAHSRQKLEHLDASGPFLPIGQTPVVYLERLMEHFVTHQQGYETVDKDCTESIRVELYPLAEGWTVFARYSGNGREERVDQLFPWELSQFAERSVVALLQDVPISATINRDNVLLADSKKSSQRVKGTNHFEVGLGTQIRGGNFNSADNNAEDGTSDSVRVFSPMTLSAGYRGKFENWAIEALGQLAIGTSKTAASRNPEGGHIDFGGDVGIALHFLRYLNPRGISSFYLGAGANFELMWFSAIMAQSQRSADTRTTLLGGGLDVDLLCGWEFMRASTVQFYLQMEANLPAYVIQNEDTHGSIHTWFPGMSFKLGVIF